jgi:hypothetical protein
VAGCYECGDEPLGNFLSSLGHIGFSGRTLLHGVSYWRCSKFIEVVQLFVKVM